MKLIIDIDEEWYSYIIASKDYIDEDDEAYLILNGVPYEERLQGEWIEKQETPASVSYYCSNCKMRDLPFLPYCPWCGAKMKGGADMRGEEDAK